jgi:hypothetical protein
VKIHIERRATYLYAELRGRESGRDMREFALAVKAACSKHGCPKILLCIGDSPAVFKAEEYGLDGTSRGYVAEILTKYCRIALLGDSSELHHAHEYIELVARQQGVNVRAFRDQESAVRWLMSPEDLADAPGSGAARSGLRTARR